MGETTNPISFLDEEIQEEVTWIPKCFHCNVSLPRNGRSIKNKIIACKDKRCINARNKIWMRVKRAKTMVR